MDPDRVDVDRQAQRPVAQQQHAAGERPYDVTIDCIDLHSFSYDAAYDAATRYIDVTEERPDGVFASNDTMAMACITAFRDAGLDVPGQISVVGYNDVATAAYFTPKLTTIRQDIHQAGRILVAKLMRILDGESPSSSIIRTEVIVRET